MNFVSKEASFWFHLFMLEFYQVNASKRARGCSRYEIAHRREEEQQTVVTASTLQMALTSNCGTEASPTLFNFN